MPLPGVLADQPVILADFRILQRSVSKGPPFPRFLFQEKDKSGMGSQLIAS
jgi:hypothetical protein